MSKPQVFTQEDIVACADEVIGMNNRCLGDKSEFNRGVLELAGYLLDIPPEEVVDLMNRDECEDGVEQNFSMEDRGKLNRIGSDCHFAIEILERDKDPNPVVNHLCREMKWISEFATILIYEKYGEVF